MEIKTFEDLDAWKICRDVRLRMSNLARQLPNEEKFRLSDQIIRASRSVTANLAEGFGRYHFQENMQFCRQSRGSLFELLDHLRVALDEGLLNQAQFKKDRNEILRAVSIVNGYIRYLGRAKSDTNNV